MMPWSYKLGEDGIAQLIDETGRITDRATANVGRMDRLVHDLNTLDEDDDILPDTELYVE